MVAGSALNFTRCLMVLHMVDSLRPLGTEWVRLLGHFREACAPPPAPRATPSPHGGGRGVPPPPAPLPPPPPPDHDTNSPGAPAVAGQPPPTADRQAQKPPRR